MNKKNNLIKNIKIYIEKIINPILFKHNGSIELINIINNNLLITFKGNCKSCNLKLIILKYKIINHIKKKFPQVNNITFK